MPISCENLLLDFLIYCVAVEIDAPVWSVVDLGFLVNGDHPKGKPLHTRKRLSCPRASLAEMNNVEILIFLCL
jgi:hypothetical protein